MMIDTQFVSANSRFFENLMEHKFLFDLCRHMVLQTPTRLVNVLKSDVDAFGFYLALSVESKTAHVQMKTRVGETKYYSISESLWDIPNAYIIWMHYGIHDLEPKSYSLLDLNQCSKKQFASAKRQGHLKVGIAHATHSLEIAQVAEILFP